MSELLMCRDIAGQNRQANMSRTHDDFNASRNVFNLSPSVPLTVNITPRFHVTGNATLAENHNKYELIIAGGQHRIIPSTEPVFYYNNTNYLEALYEDGNTNSDLLAIAGLSLAGGLITALGITTAFGLAIEYKIIGLASIVSNALEKNPDVACYTSYCGSRNAHLD